MMIFSTKLEKKTNNVFYLSSLQYLQFCFEYTHNHLPSLEIEFTGQNDSSYKDSVIESEGHLFEVSKSSMLLYQEFFRSILLKSVDRTYLKNTKITGGQYLSLRPI